MRPLFMALVATSAIVALGHRTPSQAPLQAGTAVRMDVEQMADAADRIVEARVAGSRTFQDARGRIVTEYQLDVAREFLPGEGHHTTVRIPGGVLANGKGLMLPGMPQIQVGEAALMFLSGSSELSMPTGLGQGKFRIVTDRTGMRRAIRRTSGMQISQTSNGHECAGAVHSLAYSELSARIQAAVNARLAREATDLSPETPR